MELLKRLNIDEINPGAYSGQGWHSEIGHRVDSLPLILQTAKNWQKSQPVP